MYRYPCPGFDSVLHFAGGSVGGGKVKRTQIKFPPKAFLKCTSKGICIRNVFCPHPFSRQTGFVLSYYSAPYFFSSLNRNGSIVDMLYFFRRGDYIDISAVGL